MLSIFELIKFRRAYTRRKLTNKDLKSKLKVRHPKAIAVNDSIAKELFGGGISLKWSKFYNSFSNQYSPYYIPDNLYYGVIDMFYNDYRKCLVIDDKNLYDLLFHDIRVPHTIMRKTNGVLMDSNYQLIDESTLSEITRDSGSLIIKKATASEGGKNIYFWNNNDSVESLKSILNRVTDCVVQKLIDQHESLRYLHKDSVNTIRIITWNKGNKIIPLSAVVRMGINGNKVDNASSGGIFCGLNWDGSLKDKAYNTCGEEFLKHPQGAVFKGHVIPFFDKCVELVVKVAPRLANFSKLTSWDLTIGTDSEPILIEANLAYGELDFHQITNGPLFGKHTEEMVKEVFSSRKNRILKKILS